MASLFRVASNRLRSLFASIPRKEVVQGPVVEAAVLARGLMDASGNILLAADNGIGYVSGIGGAVTQATSRTTGVTLNKLSGAITLVSAAGSTTPATFTVTNSKVAANDTISVSVKSGTDKRAVVVTAVAAGSFDITTYTLSGTTTEQPVISFNVFKGCAA